MENLTELPYIRKLFHLGYVNLCSLVIEHLKYINDKDFATIPLVTDDVKAVCELYGYNDMIERYSIRYRIFCVGSSIFREEYQPKTE